MGIKNCALKWFKNYLSGRHQRVDINGEFSEVKALDISVIQGSILGPILFLCYINDLWTATSLFSVLFADNTTCLARGKNLLDLTAFVNIELNKIANWFLSNKMAVNTAKTKFIVFHTKGKNVDPEHCKILYDANEIGTPPNPQLISPVDRIFSGGKDKSFKLLGVHFDETLSFEAHITYLCNKISVSLFTIRRVKNILPIEAMKTIYFSLIHSQLLYCINIYSSANQTKLNRLLLKQKNAIRTVCNMGYRDHTAPLFKKLKVLSLDKMIAYSRLKFMHSFTNNRLPFSFAQTWLTNLQRNPNLELRNADDLYIPACKMDSLKRLPYFALPTAWNNEDANKNLQNIHTYLRSLRDKLLELNQ